MTGPVRVLLVEDNPGDVRLIREMFADNSTLEDTYQLAHVESLGMAEKHMGKDEFDLVLLDLNLPDSTGLETLEHMSTLNPRTAIVVLTGLNDRNMTAQAIQKGAQDYLIKDELDSHLFARVVQYAIERKRTEEQLRYQATHDPLTGLPNRSLLFDRLIQATNRSRRIQRGAVTKWKTAVMLMDLNNFKWINDTHGHETGDLVLQHVSRRLESCLRQSDTVARLGGDEFVLVIEGVMERADCEVVAWKLVESLNTPLILAGEVGQLSASLGISLFPDDAEDIDTLIRFADMAMFSAKRQGDQIHFFQDETQE